MKVYVNSTIAWHFFLGGGGGGGGSTGPLNVFLLSTRFVRYSMAI